MTSYLPDAYLKKMREFLSEEYPAFLASFEETPARGLRFNIKKIRPETREKLVSDWDLVPVPWCPDGYYYDESVVRPGLSPYHAAGLFYIQEPSAMLPAEKAGVLPGDIVLDLCAAPGGKSTRLAEKAALLIANEPVISRAKILCSNIERMGLTNVIVTSAFPDRLSEAFGCFFDVIAVDAPCSGEGMFRRDPASVSEWSIEHVEGSARREREILGSAAGMLKESGRIVYSTCTFEYEENEGQISSFISDHPDFILEDMERLMPQRVRGEGQFAAVLRKAGDPSIIPGAIPGKGRGYAMGGSIDIEGLITDLSDMLKNRGIKVLRSGLVRGEFHRGRKGDFYVPSHAEAMAGTYEEDCRGKIDLLSEDICEKYLSGQEVRLIDHRAADYELSSDGGFLTVYYDRYPLGIAKLSGNVLKNHYPKGLRRMRVQGTGTGLAQTPFPGACSG